MHAENAFLMTEPPPKAHNDIFAVERVIREHKRLQVERGVQMRQDRRKAWSEAAAKARREHHHEHLNNQYISSIKSKLNDLRKNYTVANTVGHSTGTLVLDGTAAFGWKNIIEYGPTDRRKRLLQSSGTCEVVDVSAWIRNSASGRRESHINNNNNANTNTAGNTSPATASGEGSVNPPTTHPQQPFLVLPTALPSTSASLLVGHHQPAASTNTANISASSSARRPPTDPAQPSSTSGRSGGGGGGGGIASAAASSRPVPSITVQQHHNVPPTPTHRPTSATDSAGYALDDATDADDHNNNINSSNTSRNKSQRVANGGTPSLTGLNATRNSSTGSATVVAAAQHQQSPQQQQPPPRLQPQPPEAAANQQHKIRGARFPLIIGAVGRDRFDVDDRDNNINVFAYDETSSSAIHGNGCYETVVFPPIGAVTQTSEVGTVAGGEFPEEDERDPLHPQRLKKHHNNTNNTNGRTSSATNAPHGTSITGRDGHRPTSQTVGSSGDSTLSDDDEKTLASTWASAYTVDSCSSAGAGTTAGEAAEAAAEKHEGEREVETPSTPPALRSDSQNKKKRGPMGSYNQHYTKQKSVRSVSHTKSGSSFLEVPVNTTHHRQPKGSNVAPTTTSGTKKDARGEKMAAAEAGFEIIKSSGSNTTIKRSDSTTRKNPAASTGTTNHKSAKSAAAAGVSTLSASASASASPRRSLLPPQAGHSSRGANTAAAAAAATGTTAAPSSKQPSVCSSDDDEEDDGEEVERQHEDNVGLTSRSQPPSSATPRRPRSHHQSSATARPNKDNMASPPRSARGVAGSGSSGRTQPQPQPPLTADRGVGGGGGCGGTALLFLSRDKSHRTDRWGGGAGTGTAAGQTTNATAATTAATTTTAGNAITTSAGGGGIPSSPTATATATHHHHLPITKEEALQLEADFLLLSYGHSHLNLRELLEQDTSAYSHIGAGAGASTAFAAAAAAAARKGQHNKGGNSGGGGYYGSFRSGPLSASSMDGGGEDGDASAAYCYFAGHRKLRAEDFVLYAESTGLLPSLEGSSWGIAAATAGGGGGGGGRSGTGTVLGSSQNINQNTNNGGSSSSAGAAGPHRRRGSAFLVPKPPPLLSQASPRRPQQTSTYKLFANGSSGGSSSNREILITSATRMKRALFLLSGQRTAQPHPQREAVIISTTRTAGTTSTSGGTSHEGLGRRRVSAALSPSTTAAPLVGAASTERDGGAEAGASGEQLHSAASAATTTPSSSTARGGVSNTSYTQNPRHPAVGSALSAPHLTVELSFSQFLELALGPTLVPTPAVAADIIRHYHLARVLWCLGLTSDLARRVQLAYNTITDAGTLALTFERFRAYLRTTLEDKVMDEASLHRVFMNADGDRDGQLTKPEFASMFLSSSAIAGL